MSAAENKTYGLQYKDLAKSRPQNMATRNYFDGIVKRINTTEDLKTFRIFYDFISEKEENHIHHTSLHES